MKKTLTLLFAWGMMLSAASAITPPDSILVYTWNSGSSAWDTSGLQFESYDANDNRIGFSGKSYIGGKFSDSYRYTYGYDGSNRLVYTLSEYYNGSQWEPTNRTFNTYNAQGMRVSQRYELYNGATFDTLSWDSVAITLDGSNRGTEYSQFTWNTSDHTLNPSSRYVVTSFGSGNLPASIIILNWNGSSYDSSSRVTALQFSGYNGNDMLASEPTDYEMEQYNSGMWEKSDKMSSVFTNEKPSWVYRLNWDGTEWDTSSIDEFIYDTQGNQTDYYSYSWNGPGSYNLSFATRDSFVYSSTNLIIDDYTKQYNSFSGSYTNTLWKHNYYDGSVLGITPFVNILANIYPNPAIGSIHINNHEGQTLKVFDLQGKVLFDALLTDNNTLLDLNSFSKGLLLFQFTQPNGNVKVEKVINQ